MSFTLRTNQHDSIPKGTTMIKHNKIMENKIWLFNILFLLILTSCSNAGEPTTNNWLDESTTALDPSALNILFIGNSLTYSNDLPGILATFLEKSKVASHVESIAIGGTALIDHWNEGLARSKIQQGGWDFVIMQQGPSATEGRPLLLSYAKIFGEEISTIQATSAMYMVWPAKSRFFDFDGVYDSYRQAALNIGGIFLPGGASWRVAWESEPDLAFYGPDNFHPSAMGSYLVALVMFEQLTGLSPLGLPNIIKTKYVEIELSKERATMLQKVAIETNKRYAIKSGI